MYQILLTILVLIAAVVAVRLGRGRRVARAEPAAGGPVRRPSTPALIGYALVALMVVAAATVFYLRWQEANRLVTIEVIDGSSGESVTYHVRKKHIDGRSFRTRDGRRVSLGAGDRMEVVGE